MCTCVCGGVEAIASEYSDRGGPLYSACIFRLLSEGLGELERRKVLWFSYLKSFRHMIFPYSRRWKFSLVQRKMRIIIWIVFPLQQLSSDFVVELNSWWEFVKVDVELFTFWD